MPIRALRLLVWVAVVALLPARVWAACDGTVARSGTITLDVGSSSRLFVLKVPSGVDGRSPAPVVFVFHPFGMNASYMEARFTTRAWPEAIMIYPEGARGGGAASPSWQSRAGDLGDRDLLFFDAMLAWLDEHECVDPRRVFVMGYSNGAALASVLTCARSGKIAGAAIFAGRAACEPARPVPVIIGHGAGDQTIPYTSAEQATQAWSKANSCAAPPPRPKGPGCLAATACTSAPLTLCTYPGGHEYNGQFTRSAAEFLQKIAK